MTYNQILLDQNGEVASLTLNRPQVLNALSPDLIEEMLQATLEVRDSASRILVVSGAGDRAFSAGVDLKATANAKYTSEAARDFSDNARQIGILWETMPQVIIVKVAGYCFTGALELALAADFIIASDDSVFADTHARIGLRPGWGLSQRLPRRIGLQLAKEMSFTARHIPADEARKIGLILDSVPREELDRRVDKLVTACLGNAGGSIAAYKDLFRNSTESHLGQGLEYEANAKYDIPERRQMQAAILSKLKG